MITLLLALAQEFPIELYKETLKDHAGKNVFLSPTSVELALAMTWNGAGGTTREAMGKALRLPDKPNEAYEKLRKELQGLDPKVKLEIANSLWLHTGFEVKPDFTMRLLDHYAAEVTSLDFRDPGTPKTINAWVEKKTGGKIKKIIPDTIDEDVRVYIINAVYFKGDWTKAFDPKKTKDMPFVGADKKVPMMWRKDDLRYHEEDGFQAVRIPYGKNQRCAMYVFVPTDLDAFHAKLTAANFSEWMKSFHKTEVEVLLPRFKVEFEATLNEPLKRMGMSEAFTEGVANFSNLAKRRLYISVVKHKTFVDVNEEGTEAAAATSVELKLESAPADPKRIVADRPFFVVLRDDTTGSILFMGAIVKP